MRDGTQASGWEEDVNVTVAMALGRAQGQEAGERCVAQSLDSRKETDWKNREFLIENAKFEARDVRRVVKGPKF